MADLRIAVLGAGIIGRTHITTLAQGRDVALACVVDPSDAARAYAAELGVAHFQSAEDAVAAGGLDAVIIAAPNDFHLPLAKVALAAGLPVLLEKPVANDLADGEALLAVQAETGVPVLLGHHRRHNPIIQTAKNAIEEGVLGSLVTATIMVTLAKPAAYFDVDWRRDPRSGGPLAINLTHEIDLLRHFWGEVREVRALTSNRHRGFDVEDTAAVIVEFVGGGIATLTLSDAAAGPWAWDVTAGENPERFPANPAMAHAYAGTQASLSLPDLTLWEPSGTPDWTQAMTRRTLPHTPADPYLAQLTHFTDVVRGTAQPAVTLSDGVANMRIVDAIKQSGATGAPVQL